jgi:hypothetical protein
LEMLEEQAKGFVVLAPNRQGLTTV